MQKYCHTPHCYSAYRNKEIGFVKHVFGQSFQTNLRLTLYFGVPHSWDLFRKKVEGVCEIQRDVSEMLIIL